MFCNGQCFYYLVVYVALIASACAADPDAAVGSNTFKEGCPSWGCGSNNCVVNNTVVAEVDLAAKLLYELDDPDESFEIVTFQHDNPLIQMSLDVEDGMFVGTDLLGSEYTGSDLIDSKIVLTNLSSGSLHAIIIEDFGHIDSWTDPVISIPAYHLRSATASVDTVLPIVTYAFGSTHEEACGSVLPAGSGLLAEHYAVLVKGERYSAEDKAVSVSGTSAESWFNLACNGSALAKMKLLGYDPEFTDTANTSETTPEQRQATLKMITADYCGTGESFTELGEPLRWYNADGSAEPDASMAAAVSSEAIWTEAGAFCLDTPRRADEEPGIATAIDTECQSRPAPNNTALPACTSAQLASFATYGEWLTENPGP